MKKTRIFSAVFAGNMAFFFIYGALAWLLTRFNLTPYGRFVNAFFLGRTKEGSKEYIAANKELFDMMLGRAALFSNLVLTPSVAFIMGLVAGAILFSNRRAAVIWSFISALPVSILFMAKSGGEPTRYISLALLLAAAVFGGFVGSSILKRFVKEDSSAEV